MKHSMPLLALILFAVGALPSASWAGAPELDSKLLTEGKPVSFTTSGTISEWLAINEPKLTCTASKGSGKYTTKTTGEVSFTYSGCTEELGSLHPECHTSGQASGVIATGTSVFHSVYLTDAKNTPGILITPPSSGIYLTTTCGGFGNTEVKGNGYIGDLSSPKCGGTSTTTNFSFSATNGDPTYKQNTATGTLYDLTSTTGGGSTTTAARLELWAATFAEAITVTCV
jgi:hypothetical protein